MYIHPFVGRKMRSLNALNIPVLGLVASIHPFVGRMTRALNASYPWSDEGGS